MQNSFIRILFNPLKKIPFHPQWFVFLREFQSLRAIAKTTNGVVLDIGSGTQNIQKHLPSDCNYISLDYYQTATEWYHTRPQIFGDGQCLPIKTDSVDTVLLLDVLEHLPRPEDCIAEIWRVLHQDGKIVLQVPFLYPIHDEPYDFHRWTCHGLKALAVHHNFNLKRQTTIGHPIETSALLMNIALSKTVLNWIQRKSPFLIIAPLFCIVIPFVNLSGWLLARLCSKEDFMPHSYRVILEKKP